MDVSHNKTDHMHAVML